MGSGGGQTGLWSIGRWYLKDNLNMKTAQKSRQPKKQRWPKYEDELKNEDDLKNEDNLKN